MPWDPITMNDGHTIPPIAFGTWRLGAGDEGTARVAQALDAGFVHVDTAQAYRNESSAGAAILSGALPREKVFVTTKYSRMDGLDIETSLRNSLKALNLPYVDLYLIHDIRHAQPDIPTAWAEMERVRAMGLTKSIGVSNFGVPELEEVLKGCKVRPAVNQIMLHPFILTAQEPVLALCKKEGIVVEGYCPLTPINFPGKPVDTPLAAISARLGVPREQVLIAWARQKSGGVVVTSSRQRDRVERALGAGDVELSEEDVRALDEAGKAGPQWPDME